MPAPAFLDLEPLLVAHLREQLADRPNVHILTAADLAKIDEKAQHTPAVHIVFNGLSVADEDFQVEVVEHWLTVVAVRNVGDTVAGQRARAEASPLMKAVWDALYGWRPDGTQIKALRPVTPPTPGYSIGFGYYPLAWSARHAKVSTPCTGA